MTTDRVAVEHRFLGLDRRTFRPAFRKLVRDRRRARHLVEGAGDLAQELARAGGQETVRVAHSRAELLRLRGIG